MHVPSACRNVLLVLLGTGRIHADMPDKTHILRGFYAHISFYSVTNDLGMLASLLRNQTAACYRRCFPSIHAVSNPATCQINRPSVRRPGEASFYQVALFRKQ